MNETKLKPCPIKDSQKLVELIAGPLDGLLKQWPEGKMYQDFDYYGGQCSYGYEGDNKALYVQG